MPSAIEKDGTPLSAFAYLKARLAFAMSETLVFFRKATSDSIIGSVLVSVVSLSGLGSYIYAERGWPSVREWLIGIAFIVGTVAAFLALLFVFGFVKAPRALHNKLLERVAAVEAESRDRPQLSPPRVTLLHQVFGRNYREFGLRTNGDVYNLRVSDIQFADGRAFKFVHVNHLKADETIPLPLLNDHGQVTYAEDAIGRSADISDTLAGKARRLRRECEHRFHLRVMYDYDDGDQRRTHARSFDLVYTANLVEDKIDYDVRLDLA